MPPSSIRQCCSAQLGNYAVEIIQMVYLKSILDKIYQIVLLQLFVATFYFEIAVKCSKSRILENVTGTCFKTPSSRHV